MRPLLFLTIIGFGLFNNLNAQCAAQIQGPSQAISNCNGPQVSVLATGPGPYQYSWFSSTLSIQSSGSASPMLSTATPGWHSYGVYVVDSNNCTSLAVDSIEFFAPVDTFYQTYCSLPDSVCILDCPMMVQSWTFTDSLNNTVNLPLTSCVGIVGPGTYTLFGIYDMNCTVMHTYQVIQDCGSGSFCSASIQGPSQAISNCVGPQVTATATGPGPYQYTWFSPSLTITSPSSATTMISATSPGWHTLSVYVIDANNCTSIATDSIQFFAPVDTFPQTYCSLPDSICILDCPMIIQGWTYTDSLNNTINLPLDSCVAIVGPGSYNLFGIYDMNCTVMHTYLLTEDCNGTAINAQESNQGFEVYPNPFTEVLYFSAKDFKSQKWYLTDISGRQVGLGIMDAELQELQVESLPSGSYLLHLGNNTEMRHFRIQKQ
jgi:hypothetical protein